MSRGIQELMLQKNICYKHPYRRHFTGEFSVYSLGVRGAASSNNNLPHSVVVAAGHNEFCQLYKLTLQR